MDFFLRIRRITPIEITAAGIDADTVMPTRRPRYTLAAPKTTARIIPKTIDVTVTSGTILSAGSYGLKVFLDSFIFFYLLFLYNLVSALLYYCTCFYKIFIHIDTS